VPCLACSERPKSPSKPSTAVNPGARETQQTAHYTVGAMRVIPPMYGTSASGTRTDPSAC
jgi:hypothetical protein